MKPVRRFHTGKASPWLTIDQVARLMGCSRAKIYRQLRSGDIKALEFGGRWKIPRWVIEAKIRLEKEPTVPVAGSLVPGVAI